MIISIFYKLLSAVWLVIFSKPGGLRKVSSVYIVNGCVPF